MISILCHILFAIGGLIAIGAIRDSLNRYGRQALSLREALRACPDTLDVYFTVRDTTARCDAQVLRPEFSIRKARVQRRSSLLVAA